MKKIMIALSMMFVTLNSGEIKVAVAANVSYAMSDLTKAYNDLHPDTKVQVILGSSGKLTAQIRNGAPYQLFMAANMMYPEVLYKKKIAVTKPLVYAQGSLAYLSIKKPDYSKAINIVEDESIKKIAIANPKTAPYGKAALDALKNSGVYDRIKDKLVYAETVSQTVSYAMTAAEIGFIAKSSLFSPKMTHFKEGIHWSDVDPKLYTPIDQGMVILKEGEGNEEVESFYKFILSKRAKEILQAYGYLVL